MHKIAFSMEIEYKIILHHENMKMWFWLVSLLNYIGKFAKHEKV